MFFSKFSRGAVGFVNAGMDPPLSNAHAVCCHHFQLSEIQVLRDPDLDELVHNPSTTMREPDEDNLWVLLLNEVLQAAGADTFYFLLFKI